MNTDRSQAVPSIRRMRGRDRARPSVEKACYSPCASAHGYVVHPVPSFACISIIRFDLCNLWLTGSEERQQADCLRQTNVIMFRPLDSLFRFPCDPWANPLTLSALLFVCLVCCLMSLHSETWLK